MIKTEAQVRKLNEDLFFQYLLGIKKNAEKAESKALVAYTDDRTTASDTYTRYAIALERLNLISQVLRVYSEQVITGGEK